MQTKCLVEPYMCMIDKLSGWYAHEEKTCIKLFLDKMIGLMTPLK